MTMLAQFGGFSIAHWAIMIIIAAAVIAVICVALGVFKIKIPDWVIQIFWVLVVAVVAIAAIKFLVGLA